MTSTRPSTRQRGGWSRIPLRVLGVIALPYRRSTGAARGMMIAGTVLTGIVILVALFAPLLTPYEFNQVSADGERFPKQGPPSDAHPWGTNVRTNDVLARVLYGAQTELKVVALSLLLTLIIGVVLGLISGFVGGWLDRILVLIMDALFAFPYLLLAIVIAFLLSDKLGGGVITAASAITVVYIPQYFRVVRNSTVSAKEATYVEAARAIGASPATVMVRYLFTNVIQSVPVIATLNAADAILTLAGLGFLGYGIEAEQGAEWGYELNRAIDDVQAGIWWTGLFPGLAIVVLVMGLTFVGEGLNETLNPTLRVRRLLPVVLPPRDGDRSGSMGVPADQPAGSGEPAGSTDPNRSTDAREGDDR